MAHLMRIVDGRAVEGSYQAIELKTQAFEFSSSEQSIPPVEVFGLHLPDDMVLFLSRNEIMSLHKDTGAFIAAKSHAGRVVDKHGQRLS